MYFLLLGLALLLLKFFQLTSVAQWSWWLVLLPFALAALWWTWADMSGYTKRGEVSKMDERKKNRIHRLNQSLGLGSRRKK